MVRNNAVAGGGGPQVDQELGGGLKVLGVGGGAAALAVGGEGGDVGAGLGQRVGHCWAPTAWPSRLVAARGGDDDPKAGPDGEAYAYA
jgi:hypothetical protein